MNLNLIKDITEYLINNSQNFSSENWEKQKINISDDFKNTIKTLYINNRLKQKHPILSFFSNMSVIGKIFNKSVQNKKNIYIEEFENNPEIRGFKGLKKFTDFIEKEYLIECNKEIQNRDYRKLELIIFLNRISLLSRKNVILADNMYKHYISFKEYSDIQIAFKEDNLKNFLKDKKTTKSDIEKMLSLFESEVDSEFLRIQMNNLDKIKEEQEKLPDKEKDYNLYANILHLKAIIYFNLYNNKKEYIDEARELFYTEKFYRDLNFCLKEENIFDFIEKNCLNPRILYKKIKKLNDFSKEYNEKVEDTFYILFNNINNIEARIKKENISKEVIAGLKFFKGAVLELMGPQKNQQLKCKKEYFEAIKYYNYVANNNNILDENKNKLEEAKIACLTSINIFNKVITRQVEIKKNNVVNNIKDKKKPLIKYFNTIIENFNNFKEKINNLINKKTDENYNIEQEINTINLYDSLSKLDNNNAQYECGVFQEKLNQERAIGHFENAAINNNDKAKLKTIKYYLENKKMERNKYIEREILNSDISYKNCEKIAKIYKRNNEYETAIEFYNKINEKLKNKEKVKDNISRIRNTFIKIGNCFVKLGDKSRKLAKKKNNNEQKKITNNYYANAISNYKKFENINKDWYPTFESQWKITNIYKKFDNNKKYKINLIKLSLLVKDLQKEDIEKKDEKEKKYLKKIYFDLANFYRYGLFSYKYKEYKYKEYINFKEALKYYEKAADLGDIDSMYEVGYLLENNIELKNEKKALEYFLKIVNLCQDTRQDMAAIKITKLFLNNSEIKEQNKDKIFELFKNLKSLKTKFDIAKMLEQKGEILEENEAIKIFKNIIETSENCDIKTNSLFELGNIYSQRNNEEDLKYSLNCYSNIVNLDKDMTDEELERISDKIKFVTIKLNALELESQTKRIDFAKSINLIDGREKEAIEIFEELKNCENKAIKFDALFELGNIYCEKNSKKDLEYARNCFVNAIDTNPIQTDVRDIIYNKISEIDKKINDPNFIKINIQDKFLNCINDINEHFQNILPKKKNDFDEDTIKEGYIIDNNDCIILLP